MKAYFGGFDYRIDDVTVEGDTAKATITLTCKSYQDYVDAITEAALNSEDETAFGENIMEAVNAIQAREADPLELHLPEGRQHVEHHVRRPAGALLRLVRELVADSRQPQTRARTMSCGPFLRFADYRTITERVTFRTSCYDRAARTAALSAALQGGMRWVTLFPCCASSVPRCASRSSDASTETRKANCPRCARRHAGRSRLVDTRAHSITIRENEGMSRRAMPAMRDPGGRHARMAGSRMLCGMPAARRLRPQRCAAGRKRPGTACCTQKET